MSIKLIIFDLDGVIIDSKESHFHALNEALSEIDEKYVISKEEHVLKYDGLPTKDKLDMLSKEKDLPKTKFKCINERKQELTIKYIRETTEQDDKLIDIFSFLKEKGYRIHVASNSIRKTIWTVLKLKGLLEYVDYIISNESVEYPKPNPEMYLKCMIKESVGPKETMIVEDSYVGRRGVFNSGANLCAVNNPTEVTMEKIITALNIKEPRSEWREDKMNILIPMAGAGSRFEKAGYTFPKPLIDVHGKPMIQVVVENINIDANYIFIVQKSHYEKYNLQTTLNLIKPNCKIVCVDGVTEGAACTVLLAKSLIDNEQPLLLANSDQFVEWDSGEFMYAMHNAQIDGGIVTFKNTHPKWSYAKLGEDGFVCQVAEKNPISDNATVGIYLWKKGSDFVKYAEKMISKNIRVNNEFYVAPVFNEAIEDGKKIKIFESSSMFGLGTPEDLLYFLSRDV